jgi:hypothetical protein
MTDQPQAAPPERLPPWPLIVGIAVLGVLALVLLLLVITRDDGGGASSGSPTPSPSPSATVGTSGSGSPGATPSAAPTASGEAPAEGEIASDDVVATTVDNLTVREAPGVDAASLGTLEADAISFVAGGPSDADGFRWYLVSGLGLPPNSGCTTPETEPYSCPIWFGWVAAASEAGEPWLVEHEIACPEEPYTAENLALGRTALERLACFGSQPITFRGYWPEIPDDAGLGGACLAQDEPSGWLLCQNTNYDAIVIDESEDFGGIGLRVSIDPESDVAMPERGTWVEVRIHLDDPAAQACDDAAQALDEPDRPAEQYVLECRAEAVLEAAQAVDEP